MADLVPLESAVDELLGTLKGMTVAELGAQTDARDRKPSDKSAHAHVVRHLLEERGLYAGLDERGVTLKVVPAELNWRSDREDDISQLRS